MRSDERLQAYFESVMRRHGNNRSVSIPHVANKMIHIMWYMLHRDRPYRQTNKDRYSRNLLKMRRP